MYNKKMCVKKNYDETTPLKDLVTKGKKILIKRGKKVGNLGNEQLYYDNMSK